MAPVMSRMDQVLSLVEYKRWIVGNTLVVAILAVLVSLLLPNWYSSTASIFPPEEEGLGAGSLSSLLSMSALGTGMSQLPVWASPTDVYAAILYSRSVRETIVDQFDLQEVYETDNMDKTLRALGSVVEIEAAASGVLLVSVEDKDPQRAAKMANAFVSELDRVNRLKRTTSAGLAREFVETRLQQNRADLARAEDALRQFQEDTGLLEPTAQLEAFVSVAADLEAQVVLKEVDLEVIEAQLGPGHPQREVARRELHVLKEKLRELDRGREDSTTPQTGFGIPLRDYPEKTLIYLRALREVKIQEALFEFLLKQYEQFRIQEQRDTPTVQVLDEAKPAEEKSRPVRSILCIVSTLLAFSVSVALALALSSLVRMREQTPEDFAKLRRIAGEVGLGRVLDRLT